MNTQPDRTATDTAEMFAYAADVFGRPRFREQAAKLATAADMLSSRETADRINELRALADTLNAVAKRLAQWHDGKP